MLKYRPSSMQVLRPDRHHQSGFTLIEAVIVIVITGILAGIVAVFITKPVQGYVDSVRRAELTDAADVALRRITRDVRLALPNSLRVSGNTCIELIMTKSGGRYRDSHNDGTTPTTSGNSLTDPTKVIFDVMGTYSPGNPATSIASATAPADYIVVLNWGVAPLDAYSGGNRVAVAASAVNTITLNTTTALNPYTTTLASSLLGYQNARFQVVPGNEKAVSYVCTGGELRRYKAYGFNTTQSCPPSGTGALLAGSATAQPKASCTISYSSGLLSINLTLTDTPSSESVTMFQQIHVDNAP
ncbi:MAG: type II secretion system protein [Proteobacteria bacterium]|nr:type II secretion system protein [Pseudomonadota bacterium]